MQNSDYHRYANEAVAIRGKVFTVPAGRIPASMPGVFAVGALTYNSVYNMVPPATSPRDKRGDARRAAQAARTWRVEYRYCHLLGVVAGKATYQDRWIAAAKNMQGDTCSEACRLVRGSGYPFS